MRRAWSDRQHPGSQADRRPAYDESVCAIPGCNRAREPDSDRCQRHEEDDR
jgi:hypothetical protein